MKTKGKLLFCILVLFLNAFGVAKAMLEVLGMEELCYTRPATLPGGIAVVGVLCALFWMKTGKKQMLIRAGAAAGVYVAVLLYAWRQIAESLVWALQDTVSVLNDRLGIQLSVELEAEAEALSMQGAAEMSFLFILFPFFLLLGYGVVRSRVLAVVLVQALWFAAACGLDRFPADGVVGLCIVGLAAAVIKSAYRDDERAARWAVLLGTAVVLALVFCTKQFILPVFDEKYEEIKEFRVNLYYRVNEEWIPQIRFELHNFGKGSADVNGRLKRDKIPEYTGEPVYRVTTDRAPQTAVYLRGFIGKDYAGDEWKAAGDAGFKRFYREQGMELPESGRELVNLMYEAFGQSEEGYIRIEELAGKGSYSLYPYGAEMTQKDRVRWDGSARRRGSSYEFPYHAPDSSFAATGITGESVQLERDYRSYVYESFLDYPAEQLPELTAFLDDSGFRQGDLYDSVYDVLTYLQKTATYNLKVESTPRGKDFVEYFLFESHEGYCAHFASAAVLMLRYLGVPARYATGYSVSASEFSGMAGGEYMAVVRDRQAHAWVEVYLDGVGWIPVEVTPGAEAFPDDNTMEQLELTGQLTDTFESIPEPPAATEEPSQEQTPTDELPDGTAGEETQPSVDTPVGQTPQDGTDDGSGTTGNGADGADAAGNGNGGSGTAGNGNSGTGTAGNGNGGASATGNGNGGAGATGNANGGTDVAGSGSAGNGVNGNAGGEAGVQKPHWELSPLAKAVLKKIVSVIGTLLLCGAALWLLRKGCYWRMCRATDREKVFLFRRNLTVLLWISGHRSRLTGESEEAQRYRSWIEKSGFGEHGLSEQEFRDMVKFSRGLAKEEYGTLPVYKRPVYRFLDVYR